MVTALAQYVTSQKTIALYMVALGVMLLLGALLFHLASKQPLFQGLKMGLLFLGIFSAIGGYVYYQSNQQRLRQQNLQQGAAALVHTTTEKARMEKVVIGNFRARLFFALLIVAALLAIFVIKSAFIQGLLFALVIFLLGNSIIETVSKLSIDLYYTRLIAD